MGRRLIVLMCCALVVSAAAPGDGLPQRRHRTRTGASAPPPQEPGGRTSCCSSATIRRGPTSRRRLMPSVYGQLVDQGVLFKRAYVNTSLCCPSRAQIVTGLYEHHTGVDTNTVPLERPTIVEALHDVGYRTMLAGKYLNSWPCTPRPEFDRWACVGHAYPVDVLHGQPGDQRGRRVVHVRRATRPTSSRDSARGVRPSPPRRISRSSRCTRRPRRTCRRTIRGTTPCRSPRRATHRSTTTRPRRAPCTRAGRRSPRTRSRTPTSDTPGWRTASGRSTIGGDHPGRPRRPDTRHARHLPLRQRLPVRRAPALRQDRRVRGVRARAHGDPLSRDARLGPFTSRTLVSNVDIAPTLASLAGLPWQADGRSLVPLLDRVRQERPVGAADRALPRGQRGVGSLFRLVVLRASDASRRLLGSGDGARQVRHVRHGRPRAVRSDDRSAPSCTTSSAGRARPRRVAIWRRS